MEQRTAMLGSEQLGAQLDGELTSAAIPTQGNLSPEEL